MEMVDSDIIKNVDANILLYSEFLSKISNFEKNEEVILNDIKKLKTNENIMNKKLIKLETKNTEILTEIKEIFSYLALNKELFEKEQNKIDSLKEIINNIQNSTVSTNSQLKQVNDDLTLCKKSVEIINSQEKHFTTKLLNYSSKLITLNEYFESESNKMSKINLNILKSNEFIWKVDKLSEKIGKIISISSEPFFSHKNGYKLKLYLYPKLSGCWNVGKDREIRDYLGIYFCVVKGEYDDILEWPLRFQVSLIIKSQDNGQPFLKEDYCVYEVEKMYAKCFDKPLKKENEMCGNQNFVELSKLLNNKSVIKNDSIYICCSVDTLDLPDYDFTLSKILSLD